MPGFGMKGRSHPPLVQNSFGSPGLQPPAQPQPTGPSQASAWIPHFTPNPTAGVKMGIGGTVTSPYASTGSFQMAPEMRGPNHSGMALTQSDFAYNQQVHGAPPQAPPDSGVRPGAVPQMNAVQQARMQPPPDMANRNLNDPRNAALAGYR